MAIFNSQTGLKKMRVSGCSGPHGGTVETSPLASLAEKHLVSLPCCGWSHSRVKTQSAIAGNFQLDLMATRGSSESPSSPSSFSRRKTNQWQHGRSQWYSSKSVTMQWRPSHGAMRGAVGDAEMKTAQPGPWRNSRSCGRVKNTRFDIRPGSRSSSPLAIVKHR